MIETWHKMVDAVQGGFQSGRNKWALRHLSTCDFRDLHADGYRGESARYNLDRARETVWGLLPDGVGFLQLPNGITITRVEENDPDRESYAWWTLDDVRTYTGIDF